MAESERERMGYFRQRWAHENFRSQSSLNDRNNDQPTGEANLSEINAQPPVPQYQGLHKGKKRSWLRDSLRRSQIHRFSFVKPTTPRSNVSTSIRSPVDSHNNTIYSDEEAPVPQRPDGNIDQPEKGEDTEQPQKAEGTFDASETPIWLNEIYILAWLTFFALLGTLARLGVEAITQYPDTPVTSRVLWANLGGSFIMGFLVEDRNLFGLPPYFASPSKDDELPDEPAISAAHLKHKKGIPLYVGLTTGLCGSFTSFSSFIRDTFLALTNDLASPSPTTPYHGASNGPYPRNGGFSFLALMAILILHPAVSLAALRVGAHFALLVRPVLPTSRPIFPLNLVGRVINPLAIVVGFGSFVGALMLTIFTPSSGPSPVEWRARATIPLLFAAPGCILRYYLAKFLNRPSTPNFPWGTFVANVFGTFVLGMAWDLQHLKGIGAVTGAGSENVCAVMLGIEEGFCGCLTTVSTWVVELNWLRRRWAYIYGLTSVGVALGGMIAIMGGMGWTTGFSGPVCG